MGAREGTDARKAFLLGVYNSAASPTNDFRSQFLLTRVKVWYVCNAYSLRRGRRMHMVSEFGSRRLRTRPGLLLTSGVKLRGGGVVLTYSRRRNGFVR